MKMRKFHIFYNDGAYYGTMVFKDSTQEEIENAIMEEIASNNKNVNPMYHITRQNFQEEDIK